MGSAVLTGSVAWAGRRQVSLRTDPAVRPEVEDLEQAADELLGHYVIYGAVTGIYTQAQLDRKVRDERKRWTDEPEAGVADEVVNYLLDRQVDELIEVARLSAMQEIVYRLYAAGLGTKQMSVLLGVRRRTIEERLRAVKRKIRTTYLEGRYAGWYEVYLSEVNRPVYRGRG